MKNFKALIRYFDRKANTTRQVWVNVESCCIKQAWIESKASFTTIDVVEA